MKEMDGVKSAIAVLNQERDVNFETCQDNPGMFQGNVTLEPETVTIIIDTTNGFPAKFPRFFLNEPKRFYPHVDSKGLICLFDDSSLLIRTNIPDQILIDAFDRAVKILRINPNSEEYKMEVAREFNAYWGKSDSQILFTNLFPCTGNDYKELKCVFSSRINVVSDNVEESKCLLCNNFNVNPKDISTKPCMLIRLRSFEVPPIKETYSWSQLRNFIIKNTTRSQRHKFQRFLDAKRTIINRYIILSIPSEQRDFYVGFWLYYEGRNNKKVEKIYNCKVEPVITVPIDYDYLLKRCGGISMMEKSVLLLGCGSVGGYVASNLCQCGITKLDILDKDILTMDNVHRHILGSSDALKYKNKADLMKAYLEEQYLYVDIDSLNYKDRDVETLLKNPEIFRNYDVIVSATGEPDLNLKINDTLLSNDIKTPFVVCFNEPYSIGGHAIAVNMQGGCLRCMYTDIISDDLVEFRGSFVVPEQDFKKSISGCAGSFVEYSVLDSQQTAIITTRLVLNILKGECIENTSVSWVGSNSSLIEHGYKESEYYNRVSKGNRNIVSQTIPINDRCHSCSNKET